MQERGRGCGRDARRATRLLGRSRRVPARRPRRRSNRAAGGPRVTARTQPAPLMSAALPDARRPNGGVPARRAIGRWAWRLFRREWRQQVLVLALLTVAISAVIFGASAAYNMIPSRNADFGSADVRVQLTVSDPAALRDDLARLTKMFGTVDVIERANIPVPGSVDTVEARNQDPHGPYGAAMLALRQGRYP